MQDEYGINTHKLDYHPERVNEILISGDTNPIYIEVSPSIRCNAKCSFCSYGSADRGSLGIEEELILFNIFKDHLSTDLKTLGVKSVMLCGEGEPLMNANIIGMAKSIYDAGIDVAMTTNGILLGSNVDIVDYMTWIKVSLDAGTADTYSKLKGVGKNTYYKAIKGIGNAVERSILMHGGKVTIGVQMVILPENYMEVTTLANMCDDIGVDYLVLKPFTPMTYTKTIYDDMKYDDMIDSVLEQVEDSRFNIIFRDEAFNTISTGNIPKKCHALPLWMYISSDGDVYPCLSYYSHKEYIIGNVIKDSIIDIWNSKKRHEVYDRINKKKEHCRVACRMSSCNTYLSNLLELGIDYVDKPIDSRPQHVNFI